MGRGKKRKKGETKDPRPRDERPTKPLPAVEETVATAKPRTDDERPTRPDSVAPLPAGAGATPSGTFRDEPTPVVTRTDLPPAGAPRPPNRDPDPQTGGSDRRLFRRVPFFRKVEYRFQSMEEFKSQFANDLSLGGMFIRTDEPEPMGSIIYLQFDLQDGSKILSGYGKVVRVNPRGEPELDPGMGVEFLKFDDESLRRIRQLVAERFNTG